RRDGVLAAGLRDRQRHRRGDDPRGRPIRGRRPRGRGPGGHAVPAAAPAAPPRNGQPALSALPTVIPTITASSDSPLLASTLTSAASGLHSASVTVSRANVEKVV